MPTVVDTFTAVNLLVVEESQENSLLGMYVYADDLETIHDLMTYTPVYAESVQENGLYYMIQIMKSWEYGAIISENNIYGQVLVDIDVGNDLMEVN